MIKLEVETYCQNCPDFDPEVYKYSYEGDMRHTDDVNETVVYCKYKQRCHSIAKYMAMKNKHWGAEKCAI